MIYFPILHFISIIYLLLAYCYLYFLSFVFNTNLFIGCFPDVVWNIITVNHQKLGTLISTYNLIEKINTYQYSRTHQRREQGYPNMRCKQWLHSPLYSCHTQELHHHRLEYEHIILILNVNVMILGIRYIYLLLNI